MTTGIGVAVPVAVFARGQWFGVFYAHVECQETS
jgi:hypothetical protein